MSWITLPKAVRIDAYAAVHFGLRTNWKGAAGGDSAVSGGGMRRSGWRHHTGEGKMGHQAR